MKRLNLRTIGFLLAVLLILLLPATSYGATWVQNMGRFAASIIPTSNNTYSVGNSTHQISELWGNAGNLTSLGVGTLDIVGNGKMYAVNADGVRQIIYQQGGVSPTYGYSSSVYFGPNTGNSSGAAFQGGFGIGVLANATAASEGNWALGDVALAELTSGQYNNAMGDGTGRYITTGNRTNLIGDHIIYNSAGFTGHDGNVIGGGAAGNLTQGYFFDVMGQGAVSQITDIRNSVVIGRNAGSGLTDRLWNAILIGPGAGVNVTTAAGLDSRLLIGDGTGGGGGLDTIIYGVMPNTSLTFNAVTTSINSTTLSFIQTPQAITIPNEDNSSVTFQGRGSGTSLVDIFSIQSGANGSADPFVQVKAGSLRLSGTGSGYGAGADRAWLASGDIASGRRSFAFTTEETVVLETVSSNYTWTVYINQTPYKILLTTP